LIVVSGDIAKSLLPRGVPHLYAHLSILFCFSVVDAMISRQHDAVIPLVPHLYLHFLDFEVNPDSGQMASCKFVVGEACHQASLASR
jgi:hypothetical protein